MKQAPIHENVPFSHNKLSVSVSCYETDIALSCPRWHEHLELLYFFDGKGAVTCNEKTFLVEKGDLIFVNPLQIHAHIPKPWFSFCCILLYPWFFSDIQYDSRILIENCIRGDNFAKECIEAMIREKDSASPFSDMAIKGHAYTLTSYLMRNYAVSEMTEKDTLHQQAKLKRAETILYYIHNHYNEKITSENLSRMCYMNESHFCRFFKRSFGKSPLSYINEYRIEKACDLLLSSTQSITEIALSTGFEDINYFSRTFKKLKGISPTQFRAKCN